MPEKPKLPIDEMTLEEYEVFKERVLDYGITHNKPLTDAELEEIKKLVGVGGPSTGCVSCDEYHGHSFACISHYHPVTGIVDRLITELQMYKSKINKLKDIANS